MNACFERHCRPQPRSWWHVRRQQSVAVRLGSRPPCYEGVAGGRHAERLWRMKVSSHRYVLATPVLPSSAMSMHAPVAAAREALIVQHIRQSPVGNVRMAQAAVGVYWRTGSRRKGACASQARRGLRAPSTLQSFRASAQVGTNAGRGKQRSSLC